MPEQEI